MIPNAGVFLVGMLLFLATAWDAFESIILPRRVTRKFRFTRLFFRFTWSIWRTVVELIDSKKFKESFLGFYGPMMLLVLIAVWAFGLVVSFGMMQYGAGSAVTVNGGTPGLNMDFYLSGTTFFTLGIGDVLPRSNFARFLVVVESGFGFGFLAVIIGYLPFIYGAFAAREVEITLLDARAGTPPSAGELLRRHTYEHGDEALAKLLEKWEQWSALLLESHLSYPVLAYFRSQHDNQSWIASLTAILDTCVLTIAGIEGACQKQAQLTFAISRHAVVDLAQVFSVSPQPLPFNRLPPEDVLQIRTALGKHGMKLATTPEADQKLEELRAMYEPYVYALANYLNQSLPPWIPRKKGKDNWQTTAWAQSAGIIHTESELLHDDHF